MVCIRSRLICAAACGFSPDVVLVDQAPLGLGGELVAAFEELQRGARSRFILGLRDVIDRAATVEGEWDSSGAWRYLDRLYDRILVYGDRRVLSTADELGLAESALRQPVRQPTDVRLDGLDVVPGLLSETLSRHADTGPATVRALTGS